MTIAQLTRFVVEREAVRVRRELGGPPPWTLDPILQQYRFCNVRREDDKVTAWIREHWRDPHRNDPDLWFGMVVARFVNEPDCLQDIGWPTPWQASRFEAVLQRRKRERKRITNPAYMVAPNLKSGVPKEQSLAELFTDLWTARHILRPRAGDTLNSWHMVLLTRQGLGSFMAAQVVADVKYEDPHLLAANDWHTFAASGPGSRRGMNRVLAQPVGQGWREEDWCMALARVREELNDNLRWDEPLHAQDVQNCLCEFDKYERVRLGEGRPKQKYPGTGVAQ